MKNSIRQLIQQALERLTADGILPPGLTPQIQVENTKDKSHGDFASNIALMLAKPAGLKPRDLAQHLLAALPENPCISHTEIAGPGFLNFFQNTNNLAQQLDQLLNSPHLGLKKSTPPQRVVVDLSSPNLAKEMHVGHLRSTIIGDAVARVLECLGDEVIRQNHVGDWGTQFGMLLAYLEENPGAAEAELADLEQFYRAAKKRFDESPEFADRARALVVQLQAGEPHCHTLWQRFNEVSLSHCQEVYDRLGVALTPADVRGESAYNNELPVIVDSLRNRGLLSESDGALCVFMETFKTADGGLQPVIVEKRGGGYLYATTDLAAMRYRHEVLQAERVLYFVDQRQSRHFEMVFECARRAGFVGAMQLEHMGFGTMNGPDGRPFKTRDGGTVKLIELLQEAEQRAYALVKEKNPELPEEALQRIAHHVGIGAVKYADLSKNRSSDYSFNFEQMLSFEGNTAPYLLYAYTRVASLFRKLEHPLSLEGPLPGSIQLESDYEHNLAARLAQFNETLNAVASKGQPHLLCAYLYDLAGLFSSFYENCPVLSVASIELQQSRLRLAALTGRTLKQGLNLLGLETLERM